MKEIDELKEAKKRIRDLEKALSDSHMDYCLEIACEQVGTNRDELKKTTPFGLRTCEDNRGENALSNKYKRIGSQAWYEQAELLQSTQGTPKGGNGL
jgi:hypothetical protein